MGNYIRRAPAPLVISVTESPSKNDIPRDSINSPINANSPIHAPSVRVQKVFTFEDVLPETPITYVCRTSITNPVIPVISDNVNTVSEKNIVDIIEALRINPESLDDNMDVYSSTNTLHKPITPNNSLQNSPHNSLQNSPRDVDHTSFYHSMKALTL